MRVLAQETNDRLLVTIDGTIGCYDWESDKMNTAARIQREIAKIKESKGEIEVRINSLGGYLDQGIAIFEALNEVRDRVTTYMVGYCASAATIIAMGGRTRKMSKYGLMLVHRSWMSIEGNALEAKSMAEELEKYDEGMMQLYMDVTGLEREEIEALMNENNGGGKWITADEAMQYGFVTEIVEGSMAKNDIGSMAMAACGLPDLPEGYLVEGNMELPTLNFNKKMNIKDTYAQLGAIVAEAEQDKKGNALMSAETLEQINAALEEKEAALAQKESEKAALEEAKAKELEEVNAKLSESEQALAEAKQTIENLQAAIDRQMPNGADHQDDEPKDSWDEYCKEHGIE